MWVEETVEFDVSVVLSELVEECVVVVGEVSVVVDDSVVVDVCVVVDGDVLLASESTS